MAKIALQIAFANTDIHIIPSKTQLQKWVDAVLQQQQKTGEITIRIVDVDESAYLNQTYRHKTGPTNVLSFPFQSMVNLPNLPLLGDLVLCAPLVAQEAKAQAKTEIAHWAHLIVHGTLHLLGYDHINDKDAMIMENLEIKILTQLGFENPYE